MGPELGTRSSRPDACAQSCNVSPSPKFGLQTRRLARDLEARGPKLLHPILQLISRNSGSKTSGPTLGVRSSAPKTRGRSCNLSQSPRLWPQSFGLWEARIHGSGLESLGLRLAPEARQLVARSSGIEARGQSLRPNLAIYSQGQDSDPETRTLIKTSGLRTQRGTLLRNFSGTSLRNLSRTLLRNLSGTSLRNLSGNSQPRSRTAPEPLQNLDPQPLRNLAPEPRSGTSPEPLRNLSGTSSMGRSDLL